MKTYGVKLDETVAEGTFKEFGVDTFPDLYRLLLGKARKKVNPQPKATPCQECSDLKRQLEDLQDQRREKTVTVSVDRALSLGVAPKSLKWNDWFPGVSTDSVENILDDIGILVNRGEMNRRPSKQEADAIRGAKKSR